MNIRATEFGKEKISTLKNLWILNMQLEVLLVDMVGFAPTKWSQITRWVHL